MHYCHSRNEAVLPRFTKSSLSVQVQEITSPPWNQEWFQLFASPREEKQHPPHCAHIPEWPPRSPMSPQMAPWPPKAQLQLAAPTAGPLRTGLGSKQHKAEHCRLSTFQNLCLVRTSSHDAHDIILMHIPTQSNWETLETQKSKSVSAMISLSKDICDICLIYFWLKPRNTSICIQILVQ